MTPATSGQHEERLRLARMALAEVCPADPSSMYLAPDLTGEMRVTWTAGEFGAEKRKASALAALRVMGPDFMVMCDQHLTLRLHKACDWVTVVDRLLGRPCWKAAANTTGGPEL